MHCLLKCLGVPNSTSSETRIASSLSTDKESLFQSVFLELLKFVKIVTMVIAILIHLLQ